MSTDSDSDSNSNGWSRARGVALKTLLLIGGAVLLKRLTKSATRWDHSRIVAHSLTGQKYSKEQAYRDPANYFNIRWLSCPAAEMVMVERFYILNKLFGGLLSSLFISDYCSFNHDSMKPYKSLLGFRARFFMVKPCPKEMKCDVELSTYAVRDAEGCKNFCDRSKDQRPQPEEVIGDIAEHLTTIHLKHSERGNPAYMKVQLHEMDFQILGFGESKEVLMNSSPQLLQVS